MIARAERELPVCADVAWTMVRSSTVQMRISRGFFSYGDELPEVRAEGFEFATRLRLFGMVPAWIHRQRVAVVDSGARTLVLEESGLPYRSWQHRMSVEEVDRDRCRFRDEIRLSSGAAMLPAWAFARLLCVLRTRRLAELAVASQRPGGDGGDRSG